MYFCRLKTKNHYMERGSQDINYALISALYASGTNGLYSDVYFPIIKYTIVQLFNQKFVKEKAQYFTAQDVHDYIWDKFKIHIPIIVIAKSLQKIDATKKDFVELKLMENGNSFLIMNVWDSHEFEELAERENYYTDGLNNIEKEYKEYLQQNGCYDDGVSYLQFIADNADEVLGYFQNNDVSLINEKYVTVVFFLEYLNDSPLKKNEFIIANQLFWASIIAGYLKSEKPPVDAAEDGSKKEYFFDTSILMGLLKLSSPQKEDFATEIRDIINSSGGLMRAHPMTLEEIKSILASVETSACPDPGTDIAEAYINHKLNANQLAKIRLNLSSELKQCGVMMFPIMGPEECRKQSRVYMGKKIVEELARERSKKSGQDNFREIHDLFMDDYIKERRKEKKGSEDVVFVTSNRDLISFTRNLHPDKCYMMSTDRLVLELWMHNVKPANISSCALTETMVRCLDLHNVRVRKKIIEVSRFFNENKGAFDPQVYQDFIKQLYGRARNVIMTVESNPDNQDTLGELTAQRILDAVKADKEYNDKRLLEYEANKAFLSSQLEEHLQTNKVLVNTNLQSEECIESLNKKNEELTSQISEANKKLVLKESQVNEEKEGRLVAEKKVALLLERDGLKKQLEEIKAELDPLEREREESFTNSKPVWLIAIGVLLILIAIAVVVYAICKEKYGIIACGTISVALGVFFFNRANSLNDKKEKRKEDAFKEWENKEENSKYNLLNEKKRDVLNRIKEIDDRVNSNS